MATDLSLDHLETLARAAAADGAWPFNINVFRKHLTPVMVLDLIAAARRAVPAQASACVICCATEPHTGTCGSDDPRALCNRPAQASAPEVAKPVAWLKEWDSCGGARKGMRCVELRPECETWLSNMFPRITPLYAAPVPAQGEPLTQAEIDDMAFGYCPSGKIGELRAFAAALIAAEAGRRKSGK